MDCFAQSKIKKSKLSTKPYFKKNLIKFITIPSRKNGNKYFVYSRRYGIQETEDPFFSVVGTYKSVDSIKDLIK